MGRYSRHPPSDFISNMKRTLFTFLALVGAFSLSAQTEEQPILILVSIDGGRWDYVEKFQPPVLSDFAEQGVSAERMLSCYPSKTFPNHYSIATGLRPESHGIVSNTMYDPSLGATFTLGNGAPLESRWWGGEPIWVTAEKQGLRSASMFWPGSEAAIKGMRPTHTKAYQFSMTCEERVDQVINWLSLPDEERPRFIALYFDVVDTAGHTFGPATPEVGAALADIDQALGKLRDGVRDLGLASRVNFLITADHGMTKISTQRRITLDDFVDPASVQIDSRGQFVSLRPLQGTAEQLLAKFEGKQKHFQAYLREEVPSQLHYSNHLRIPPVVLVVDNGWHFDTAEAFRSQDKTGWGNGGAHGYDPAEPDMGALFIASGPVFQSGKVIPSFENIHVYDLMCTILDLQPAPNEGDHRLTHQVLKAN